jgi:hypothetical protein
MIRRVALFVAAAAAFAVDPLARELGVVAGAGLLVLCGVALALAASGTISAIAAAAGAAGAFASGVLLVSAPAAAGAALVSLCYAERTLRVRGTNARASHVVLALVGGALAGLAAAHYSAAGLLVRGVVVVVCAVLAALPLLVEAEDPLAHALDELAGELDGAAQASLREGAELRRSADASLLDPQEQRLARDTWRQLLRLGEARARLVRVSAGRPSRAQGDAVARRLDERIGEHVGALGRIYSAAGEARAAETSLEVGALRGVETRGETLENVSQAIVEVGNPAES